MTQPAQILVVEDNETNLMIFRDILAASGHQVLEATTAEEAFKIVSRETPDLILMDIQLPGMNGLDAVRKLRKNPTIAPVPIIALTAHAMTIHREQAISAGCDGYITKPIRAREFRETVSSYLTTGGTE